jgi:hypothetical protein
MARSNNLSPTEINDILKTSSLLPRERSWLKSFLWAKNICGDTVSEATQYADDVRRYYDTIRQREKKEPDRPPEGATVFEGEWMLPELWRETQIGNQMGSRPYSGFGESRDK